MKEINLTIPSCSAFTDILFNLAAKGFEFIKIEYSGSGDSGAIDSVELVPKNVMKINEFQEIEWLVNEDDVKYSKPNDELKSIIEDKVYKHVLNNASDWYNDDGGGGVLYISTLDGEYYGEHYTYELIKNEEILTGKFGDN